MLAAQCHDHPLDHWTQDDYFSLAACWAEIEPSPGGARRIPQRTTTDLRTGRAAVARLPGEKMPRDVWSMPADHALVDWLCDEEHTQFADNLANRLWTWLMGSGLVEEVDDHRATNPAINPELLRHLRNSLVQQHFSLRGLVREIVLSQAYARDSHLELSPIEARLVIARRANPIALPLEQMLSSAMGAGPLPSAAAALSETTEMMMAVESAACTRGAACTDPFSESLELVSGSSLNSLIVSVVAQEWNQRQSPIEQLASFHERLFGVPGTEQQQTQWQGWLNETDPSQAAQQLVEDILWSWVVSDEFRRLH